VITYAERLEAAKNNRGKSNCIGTMLFLTGNEEEDCHMEPRDFANVFDERLVRLSRPERYSIVLLYHFDTGEILHSGVVTSVDPLAVTFRAGNDGPIMEDHTLEQFEDIDYHVPMMSGFFVIE